MNLDFEKYQEMFGEPAYPVVEETLIAEYLQHESQDSEMTSRMSGVKMLVTCCPEWTKAYQDMKKQQAPDEPRPRTEGPGSLP